MDGGRRTRPKGFPNRFDNLRCFMKRGFENLATKEHKQLLEDVISIFPNGFQI
jgi:hypothetical protein